MTELAIEPVVGCKIRADTDVVIARQLGRKLAENLHFSRADQALIATAISELARNVVKYAGTGSIEAKIVSRNRRRGIQVTVKDDGPGIPDLDLAMTDGYSTGKSLGLGLPGTRRMVDDFTITSTPGAGVQVTFVKWQHL
jgi:serine/threonine-protein kinase RsbT